MDELCTPKTRGLTDEDAVLALRGEVGNLKERIDQTELFYRV